MCQVCIDNDNGKEIGSIGELKSLCEHIEWHHDDGSHLPPETCLCWVDIPMTLLNAGFKVWRDPLGNSDYFFERVSAALEEGE